MGIIILIVCRFLRVGEQARVFNPHNPWMIGLYTMLIEYLNVQFINTPELDNTTRMEIELVLKNCDSSITQYKQCSLFRDYE
jgi:hypothetical protein